MKLGTRALVALLVSGGLTGALAQLGSGCQQSPTVVPVRSLERSGKVSFVCLSPTDPTFLPLTECTAQEQLLSPGVELPAADAVLVSLSRQSDVLSAFSDHGI